MAKVIAIREQIVISPPAIKSVTLELSKDEAETLRLILGKIGGCPDTTRRGHTGAISEALEAAGVQRPAEFGGDNGIGPFIGRIDFSKAENTD